MPVQLTGRDVHITGGFWARLRDVCRNVSADAIYGQYEKTGRIRAMRQEWRDGEPDRPHIFWDSDVAKWIEGVAYLLADKRDARLEALIDDIVEQVAAHQAADGYYNSYYQQIEPAERFTSRGNHELYCAGHFIEAAVAYAGATGKDRLLGVMRRYADLIGKIFTAPDRRRDFVTPGHEEIELALCKLYRYTGEERYLRLAKFFIDKRGTSDEERRTFAGWANPAYGQDHAPVREQRTAEGHAVRCMYLFAGAADVAREYNDEGLADACRAVWDNIVSRRMYVTGGVGANFSGEAFSYDYHLPNEEAYTETCASIGMIFLGVRLARLTRDARWHDVIELQLYNGALAGLSLSGDRYFYCNPLEVYPERRDYFQSVGNRQFAPEYQRPEMFDCSCCPPNILRLIASVGDYFYMADPDTNTYYVNQYGESTADFGKFTLEQSGGYPWRGDVSIKIRDVKEDCHITLALRVPGWCGTSAVSAEPDAPEKDGYKMLSADLKRGAERRVELHLDMPVREIYCNPAVHENRGKVAVARGPLIYCLEQAGNTAPIRVARVAAEPDYAAQAEDGLLGGIVTVRFDGEAYCEEYTKQPLYSSGMHGETKNPYKSVPHRFTMIPYYAWANREPGDMNVWIVKSADRMKMQDKS